LRFLHHTHARTHIHPYTHTPDRTLNKWWADRKGRYLHNTKQTEIKAPGGIWTRDPSNQTPADLRFRPHSHRDMQSSTFAMTNLYAEGC